MNPDAAIERVRGGTMRHHERGRASRPDCEGLEGRRVLSAAAVHAANPAAIQRAEALATYQAEFAKLKTDFRRMAADLQRMQRSSDVTPTEILALKRDL